MATEPNKKLLGDPRVPRITIDDVDWPLAKLAPQQLEVVVPLIDPTLRALRGGVTREVLHDLGTILHVALTRGHPDLTREEFDQMPLGVMDLLDSLDVVTRQCGIFRAPKPGEVNGVTAPLAVAATSSQTG